LAEICVAMVLLVLAATGVAQLFGAAMASIQIARIQTSTTVLASQKVEQLRALGWADPALAATAAGSLDGNVTGSVDYLDGRGLVVGTGAATPASARFIRRWSITPLPNDTANALILQVLATTVEIDRRARAPRRRLAGDAVVTTILTRLGR
jgi:hypothetical protein